MGSDRDGARSAEQGLCEEVEASDDRVGKCLLGDRDCAGRAVPPQQHAIWPSRASDTILRVNTLQEVSKLLPRLYRDAVVHSESRCRDDVEVANGCQGEDGAKGFQTHYGQKRFLVINTRTLVVASSNVSALILLKNAIL